jgi:phytoene dehydrogenase-like protein
MRRSLPRIRCPAAGAIALGRSAAETAASVGRVNRGDAAAWAELDQRFGDGVVALVRAGMVRWPLGQGAQLLGRLGPRNLLELCRLVIQGGSAIADRFASEGARAFLVAPGMHSDLQPEVGGSGAYALIMHLGERVGMPVAEGGSGAVSAALAEAIRHAGG